MPRCVRPFWVDAFIDGRTDVKFGPQDSAGGCMTLYLYARENRGVTSAGTLSFEADRDGKLRIVFRGGEHENLILWQEGGTGNG